MNTEQEIHSTEYTGTTTDEYLSNPSTAISHDISSSTGNVLVSFGGSKYEVEEIKKDLNDWKFILLPLNNLLEWEHKFDPLIIISIISVVFGILMIWSPSVITTVALVGLIFLSVDFIAPLIIQNVFKGAEWTPTSESKYLRICERLTNFCNHVVNFKNKLIQMRKEKHSLYFLVVLFFLIFCIYVGQLVDNLLLSYLAVSIACLMPGARRHNLIEKTMQLVKSLFKKQAAKIDLKKST